MSTHRSQRVLIIGPGRRVRGGITSVILNHESYPFWAEWNCRWLETYDDRGVLRKITQAVLAILKAPLRVASADIIHIHLAASVSACRKLPFTWLAVVLRKRLVLHFHAPSTEWLLLRTPAWVLNYLIRNATIVVTLSGFWRDFFIENWPGTHVEIIPNPAPRVARDNSVRTPRTILYVGKIERRKGYDVLLRAFAEVVKIYPEARLWFAGDGDIAHAAGLAHELGVEYAVDFLGWISGPDKASRLQSAEIFCLPSFAEGVPMSVLEAMAYGVPVITTPVGGIPDVVRDGETGILVPPGDSQTLALGLIKLLGDHNLQERVSCSARHNIERNFSGPQVSELISNLYDSVLTAAPYGAKLHPKNHVVY